MKNFASALLLCLGVMACGMPEQDELSGSMNEDTALATEVVTSGDEANASKGEVNALACTREYTGICNAGYSTCNFECCSGAIRSIQEVCGNCLNRAESWCGSGVKKVWWTP
ncbi:hypothetical protein [Cystobacter fuscus]|uniref:hypothetical protein n=1 Tax=Cystobacter fuscus TaxID=43 RepID=UPI002B2C0EAF|nr:hypothetical protein F0U63_26300 [Cystobacter fuscus]